MFSVLAPGPRSLRVATRMAALRPGVLPWRFAYLQPGGSDEFWTAESYIGDSAAAWERAVAVAGRAGAHDEFRRAHALIGPYARLYSVRWSGDDQRPLARFGWQLDRTLPADRGLEAIGFTNLWRAAVELWTDLLGRRPAPRFGPWSLDLTLGAEPRWRLGSTNWTRAVEDRTKRTRFASLVEKRGGDRRFAEVLYKLAESAARPGRSIGRAVEVELVESTIGTAEFYLCFT